VTIEDRQNFLSTISEFSQATSLSQEDISKAISKLVLENTTLEKQMTILLDRLIEVSRTNEFLRETLDKLQKEK
jgi:hypothetical protein